ncbi:MAG: hypothetical protein QOF33_4523 [Thermomicrobiales bacterium]|nr:hypothetical protein [Thermomicrobiales bacterium]
MIHSRPKLTLLARAIAVIHKGVNLVLDRQPRPESVIWAVFDHFWGEHCGEFEDRNRSISEAWQYLPSMPRWSFSFPPESICGRNRRPSRRASGTSESGLSSFAGETTCQSPRNARRTPSRVVDNVARQRRPVSSKVHDDESVITRSRYHTRSRLDEEAFGAAENSTQRTRVSQSRLPRLSFRMGTSHGPGRLVTPFTSRPAAQGLSFKAIV